MSPSTQLSEAPLEEMDHGPKPVSFLSLVAFAFCLVSIPSIWLQNFSTFAGIAILLGVIAAIRGQFQPASLLVFSYITIVVSGSILCWNISAENKYQSRFINQGEVFARQWIEHIANNEIEKALALQVEYPNRLAPTSSSEDLKKFYEQTAPIPERKFSQSPAEVKTKFLTGGKEVGNARGRVISLLVGSGGKVTIKRISGTGRALPTRGRKGVTTVNIEFEIYAATPGGEQKGILRITLERVNYSEGAQWRVKSWDAGEET